MENKSQFGVRQPVERKKRSWISLASSEPDTQPAKEQEEEIFYLRDNASIDGLKTIFPTTKTYKLSCTSNVQIFLFASEHIKCWLTIRDYSMR